MEFKILRNKMKNGLNVKLSEDFRTVEIEELGKANISYSNIRQNEIGINFLEISQYANNFLSSKKFLDDALNINLSDSTNIKISISDDDQKRIKNFINKKFELFENDLLEGKIDIYLCILKESNRNLFTVNREELSNRYNININDVHMFYYSLLEEKYKLNPNHFSGKDGDKITQDILFKIKKNQEFKIKKDKEKAAIFEKARLTNEKQLLSKWSEECNDENEDCDIDNCYMYAMPDGSTKIERIHTY